MQSEPPKEMIVLVEYDPGWPTLFHELSIPVQNALGDIAVGIEHIGSTAVPGLLAKPVIDIDVVIRSLSDLPIAVTRLAVLGYTHQGDLGIHGREAFRAPASSPAHHLYVCPVDGAELRRHRQFRDYLRTHPEVANKYAALKRDALRRFPLDRIAYTTAKSDFIEEVLRASPAATESPAGGPSDALKKRAHAKSEAHERLPCRCAIPPRDCPHGQRFCSRHTPRL